MSQEKNNSNNDPPGRASLEDSALKKIEAQLAERLVARPALIDREQLMRQASWQAGWAAAQRQREEELETASHSTKDSSKQIPLNNGAVTWPIAIGGLTMASLLLAVVLLNREVPIESPKALQASTNIQTINDNEIDLPASTNSLSPGSPSANSPSIGSPDSSYNASVAMQDQSRAKSIDEKSESGGGGLERNNAYDWWRGNQVDSRGRPIYRAGLGSFPLSNLDWMREAKPIKEDKENAPVSIPLQNASRQRATVHNMMREWLIQTKKLESD